MKFVGPCGVATRTGIKLVWCSFLYGTNLLCTGAIYQYLYYL
jgi:hypothetical protein